LLILYIATALLIGWLKSIHVYAIMHAKDLIFHIIQREELIGNCKRQGKRRILLKKNSITHNIATLDISLQDT